MVDSSTRKGYYLVLLFTATTFKEWILVVERRGTIWCNLTAAGGQPTNRSETRHKNLFVCWLSRSCQVPGTDSNIMFFVIGNNGLTFFVNSDLNLIRYIDPGPPNLHFRTPPKNASGFPIRQWSKKSETPPGYSPWVIRPR